MPCDWSPAIAIPRGQCRAVEEARSISFDRCVYPAGTGLLECVHVDVEQWRSLGSCNYSRQGLGLWKNWRHTHFLGAWNSWWHLMMLYLESTCNQLCLPVAGISFNWCHSPPVLFCYLTVMQKWVWLILQHQNGVQSRLKSLVTSQSQWWTGLVILALVPLQSLLLFQ